jgi:hypothetical protein
MASTPPMHGLKTYRRALARLGTTKLDQRSAVDIGVKHFKADVIRDEFPAPPADGSCRLMSGAPRVLLPAHPGATTRARWTWPHAGRRLGATMCSPRTG